MAGQGAEGKGPTDKITETLSDFVKWTRTKAAWVIQNKPVEWLVEEFKREQKIREDHKADEK